MSKKITAIRGFNDILPDSTGRWQQAEDCLRELMQVYGYREIRLPLVESTELFCRSIGEVTDIVEKEMYTFADRNGESLTLRPEGTAGCVRAGEEHGLFYNQTQRLWYTGPMFRYERPQKGRYRQFHQFGVEAFGMTGPDIDAELILLTARLWRDLGLGDHVSLELNSLGSNEARAQYRDALVAFLRANETALDDDSRRRLESNPLRVLDSKDAGVQELLRSAPVLTDYLDAESQVHLAGVREVLDRAGVAYTVNPRLVRGLDYYNRTVFEWITNSLGAQGTVCAGGRYDGLVEQLGGRATPAVGFAIGLERLVLLLETVAAVETSPEADVFLIASGAGTATAALLLAERIRDDVPGLRVVMNCGGGSFKSQFKKADRSGAEFALILGEDELAAGRVNLKWLREEGRQEALPQADVAAWLKAHFAL